MRDQLLHGSKILIIDDDPRGIEILRRVLGAEGYAQTMGVTDPREAIDKFRSYVPDLIILDLIMPALSGLKVLKELRSEGPAGSSVPVLIVTGDPSVDAPREALEAGANDFIRKPYDRSEIVLRVRNLLTTRLLHLEIQKQNELLEARVEERTRQLSLAQEHWEKSFDAIPDHVAILDLSGKIVRANRAMRARFEPIHGNLIGLDYRLCYCGTATPDPQPPCAAVLAGSGSVSFEGPLPALEGWFAVSSHPIFDQAGRLLGAVSAVRDITKRKRTEEALSKINDQLEGRVSDRTAQLKAANQLLQLEIDERRRMQEALRESEARFHRIAANAPGMVYQFLRRTDDSMLFPYVSEGSRALFGMEPAEIEADANTLISRIHPADLESFTRSVEESAASLQDWHWEGRFLRSPAEEKWIHGASRPGRQPNGDILWDGLLMDVTARRKAGQAALFQAQMLDSIGEAVIATDPAGKIVYVNHHTEVIYGWPRAEMIGKNVLEVIPAGPSSEQAAEIMEKLRQGETWSGEFPVQRRDGTGFEARVVDTPLFDERGELIAIIGISSDITERRKAEEALRESETRFRQMADSITDIFWMASTDGNEIIFVSPAFEKIWGRPREELKENPWLWAEAIHPDDRERVIAAYEKMTVKQDFEEEYRVVRPDGSFRWVKDRGFPVRDAKGKFYRVAGIIEDITERKRARDDLNRFFNLSADMLAIAGFDGYLKQINPAWEMSLGWPEEELTSRPIIELVHPDDKDKTLAARERLYRGLETIAFQNRYRCKDGTYKILTWNARADVSQQLIYATARDITQSKEIEDARQESEAKLRAIVDSTPSVVFVKDPESHFIMVNRRFETLFGVRSEEILGRNNIDNLPPAEAAIIRQNDLAVFQSGRAMEFEEIVRLPDGLHVFLSVKVPLFDATGRAYALCGIATDITERKRGELALREAKDAAEQANRAKSEFLSRMSHELRTPLNAILGFGELLDSSRLEPEDAESVSQIVSAGRHLLTLINDVLDISGIEAGRLALSLEPVSLGELVQEILTLLRPVAAARQVVLPEFECDLHVMADVHRLRQVILNLLSNAIKYNEIGGRVALTAEIGGNGAVRLSVCDTGRGIAAEDLPRTFTPFERMGAAGTDTEGIGLGLAISKRLIEMMGGTIGVESVPGEGSTFWIELPLARTLSPAASNGETPSISNRKTKIEKTVTLLYIEDNLSNLTLIERVIARRPGMKLVAAQRGSLGLDLARTHQPDLILLDLHLPDLQGDKVLEQLLADPRTAHIPVVIVSADATPDQIARLKAAGAREYVTKPIDVHNLLAKVDQLVSVPILSGDAIDGERSIT